MTQPQNNTTQPDFGDGEEATGPIDLVAFEALCEEAFKLRDDADKAQELADIAKAQAKATEEKVLFIMEEAGKDKHFVTGRGLIFTKNMFNVSMPKGEAERAALFDYLDKKGLYDQLITINPMTLTSFYKSQLEEAVERGDHNFKIPGITDPFHIKKLAFRRGK